jgi:hypothetical protein
MVHGGYRRWLPPDDNLRQAAADNNDYGCQEEERRPPPTLRTHAESKAQGTASEEYDGPADAHPKNNHGISGWCPLTLLPQFNIIWDICPDMMHIVKNLMERVFVKLMGGKRIPALGKALKHPPKKDKHASSYAAKLLAYKKELERHRKAHQRATVCTLTSRSKLQVDVRFKKLSASQETGIPTTMAPFETLPGYKKQSAATWVTALRFFMPYVLYGVSTETCRKPFLDLCYALCSSWRRAVMYRGMMKRNPKKRVRGVWSSS